MRNRIVVSAGVAVLIVAATVFALAQEHRGMGEKMRGGGPGDMIEHMSRELNLTDAQKEQVRAIMEAGRASGEQRHVKLQSIHKQLKAATANGQFDEALVRPLANQQAQLMADEMVDHMRMHSKIFGLLTAEQRTKAEQMMKMHGGPGGPRGPGGPGHGPGGPGHHGPPPPPPGF